MAELLPSEIAIARLEEFLGQNGLGNAPMDAGSLSGVMSSGFAPFFGGAQRNMARNMRSQDMVRRISEDNERVNAAVTWMGRQGANLNPEARKTTKQLLSSMWNSQFFSEHVGGSDIDLAFGIQNAVQASGFRVAGQRVMGSGPVSDQLTMDMWKGADKYFFEGGFGNLRRTQGFDRTQIGQIASALGARGAFAGMDASKDIRDRKSVV